MDVQLSDLPSHIVDWYKANARELPWRISPRDRERGKRPDPYHVWLSEIMLQQTTVKHAIPYYKKFIQRWPTIRDLAKANEDDVLSTWAGLGYYARARNLLKCAQTIALSSEFPSDPTELIKYPGIGEYTSKAIASIAFGKPYLAVDTNVERVFSRILALKQDWKEAKRVIKKFATQIVPNDLPSEYCQGLMDLGATVCTPKQPKCSACPVQQFCRAYLEGDSEAYPRKPPKAQRPNRYGLAFFLVDGNEVLLERRNENGLLGGMLGFPCTEWKSNKTSVDENQLQHFAQADWQNIGEVKHTFTHFTLNLAVYVGRLKGDRPDGIWKPVDKVTGLPTLFKKILSLVTTSNAEVFQFEEANS